MPTLPRFRGTDPDGCAKGHRRGDFDKQFAGLKNQYFIVDFLHGKLGVAEKMKCNGHRPIGGTKDDQKLARHPLLWRCGARGARQTFLRNRHVRRPLPTLGQAMN